MADKITAPDVIEAKQLVKDIGEVEKAFASLLSQMKLVTAESGNFKTQSQGNKTIQERVKLEGQAGALIKERARLEADLTREQAKRTQAGRQVNANLQKERVAVRQLNKEQREAATLTSRYVGAYQKLNLQRTIAARTLRDLLASEKASNAEIEKAQRNFDKLDAKVRKADSAVRDSTKNVGNYKSAFQGIAGAFRQLVGAFGIIEGLRLGFSFTKDAIELARQAKGVEFAFDRLGAAGVKAFTEVRQASRGLISDLDIKTALVDFDNFNISLEESATLFEFLSVRSAQTGKSIDSLRDSLVEGLSKESRLRIDNLGISAAQLNDELEKTPDFVQAVANIAKTEVAQAGNILDEAANSSERWAAALQNAQLRIGQTVNEAEGLSFFARVLQAITEQTDAAAAAREEGNRKISDSRVLLNLFTASGREANRQIIREKELRDSLNVTLDEQQQAYVKLNGTIGPLLKNQKELVEQFDLSGPIRTVEFLDEAIGKLNDKLLQASTRDEAAAIQSQIDALEKEKEAILGVNKVKKETQTLIEGTIAYYNDLISKETEFQQNEAKTADAIKASKERIDEYQIAIDRLNGAFQKLTTVEFGVNADVAANPTELTNFLGLDTGDYQTELENELKAKENAENAKLKLAQDSADKQAELVRGVFQEFQNLYGIDAQAFANLFDSKKNDVADFANAAIELNNLLFNIAEENRQQDLENARAVLDKTLEDTTKSDEQKAAAQEKFRKEEAKIKKKSFEADKKAAILNVQIATAVGIAKLWASPGFPAAIPLTVLLAALGIAQTAVIASKKPPKFFKGTRNAPEGFAWTDEQGAEIHTDKHGNVKDFGSNKGPRLKWLESGDQIFTAPETKAILSQGHQERVAYKQRQSDSRLYEEVKGLRREMARYANRVPQLNVNAKVEQPITGY